MKIPSPCIDICKYKLDNRCIGCFMTKKEKKTFKSFKKQSDRKKFISFLVAKQNEFQAFIDNMGSLLKERSKNYQVNIKILD